MMTSAVAVTIVSYLLIDERHSMFTATMNVQNAKQNQ